MKRLRLGAVLHFIIAIGHIGCLFALDEAFDAYGIKDMMHNTMKHIPNILSASRIALCLPLLMVDAMTLTFWGLYLIAGITGQSYFIPVAWMITCIALFAAIQECNATLRPLG